MSGRRRRNNEDSEEEDSEDEGTEDSGDNESEDDDEEANVGVEENVSVQKAVEYPTAEKVADPIVNDVDRPDNLKFVPKDILKRNSNDEQQQDRDRRDKNNKRREVKREADFFSHSQRKNPSFVPLSGNFFLHDDRDSTRLIGDEGEQSQLTEANLNKQTMDQNQQRTRCHTIKNSRAVISTTYLITSTTVPSFDCRKERPNQRERGDRDDSRGTGYGTGTGTGEKDVWRHDKFEELQATESPRQTNTKGQGQGHGRDRDGTIFSGGRGRGGRGDSGGRGGGRGREGRGGRGQGFNNSSHMAPNQNQSHQYSDQNGPHTGTGTGTVHVPVSAALSVAAAGKSSSSSGASAGAVAGHTGSNSTFQNGSNSVNSNSNTGKQDNASTRKSLSNIPTPVAPSTTEAPVRARERGNIMTSGVFAAVQSRQRNALERKDERGRKDSHPSSDAPPVPSPSHPLPQGIEGVKREQTGAGGGVSRPQSQSHSVNAKPSQDIRQNGTKSQNQNQSKGDRVEQRTDGVITNIAAAIEDVTRIETDNKIALRAMKADAKVFKPTPSSSSAHSGVLQSEDKAYGFEGEKSRLVSSSPVPVYESQSQSSGAVNAFKEKDTSGHQGQGQGQGLSQTQGQNQNQGQGQSSMARNYASNTYPTGSPAPRYAQSVYEIPHQLMNAPLTYADNAIYTDAAYPEAYMDGYVTQGGGQIMYNLDDRLGQGGILGVASGHRHQVLVAAPMGIDPRAQGEVMTGQIGGTTYYDKGVTYYDPSMNYSDGNVSYGAPGLGETFDPYGNDSIPYSDMRGQTIMIGNDGLAVTVGYDDMSGGYYSEEGADMRGRGRETNRPDTAHSSNGSTYYPQQSGALVPYVNYSLPQGTQAAPEGQGQGQGPKVKPLDLDGKAKPFSPALMVTSTANSTFSRINTIKVNSNIFADKKGEMEGKVKVDKEVRCDTAGLEVVVAVEEVEELDGVEEQKGNKDISSTGTGTVGAFESHTAAMRNDGNEVKI